MASSIDLIKSFAVTSPICPEALILEIASFKASAACVSRPVLENLVDTLDTPFFTEPTLDITIFWGEGKNPAPNSDIRAVSISPGSNCSEIPPAIASTTPTEPPPIIAAVFD